jgi:hypothetical protein
MLEKGDGIMVTYRSHQGAVTVRASTLLASSQELMARA